VMLTNKSPFSRFQPKRGEVIVALAIGAVLLAALVAGLVAAAKAGQFAARPLETGDNYPVAKLGQVLLGDYLAPFEIVSVLLLVVMIGAAYLAKGRRREREASDEMKPPR
jgi:NADH-quinone oxidoreductase subunit J